MSALEVSRHEIAGVPVFVVEEPGPIAALGITFRVGRTDETAPMAGITHLVEHLLLPASADEEVDFNGDVAAFSTSMYARGDPADLVRFLNSIVHMTKSPPFDRLEVERRTLLAEEATWAIGGAPQALALRYGPQGVGLAGFDEYGLRRISPSDVESWLAARFARETAAVWVSGVRPEQLDLDLAGGVARAALPDPKPLDDLLTPSVYAFGSGTGICLSLLGGRSPTTNFARNALRSRLMKRLRFELGLSYTIAASTQPLTESLTQITLVADVADSDVAVWLDEALSVLDRLVTDGPDPEWLELSKRHRRRDELDPEARVTWAASRADFELLGRPFQTHAAHLEGREAVTEADIANYLGEARESLLVLSSESTPLPAGFHEYPIRSTQRVSGRRHRPRSLRDRVRRTLRKVELISGNDGITSVYTSGDYATALYESAAVCLHRDGQRTVVSHDGVFVNVTGADWAGGQDVIDRIDAAIPAERVVVMDRSTAPLE